VAEVWVKMEAANPTGSYKDRMALAMIEEAERAGRLLPGQPVVEYTGGSTARGCSPVPPRAPTLWLRSASPAPSVRAGGW
jgi:cysteine synthase